MSKRKISPRRRGRPTLPAHQKRVVIAVMVAPATRARLARRAKRERTSQGRVIDALLA